MTIIVAFIAGKFCIKHSPKKIAIIFAVVFMISTAMWGYADSAAELALLMCVSITAAAVWAYNVNPVILSNWFPRKKGIVMGWATMGCPVAAGTTVYFYNFGAKLFGVKGSFVIYSIIVGVALIMVAFLLSDNPETVGCYPDNDQSMSKEDVEELLKKEQELRENSPWTTQRLLRTPKVWKIALCQGVLALFSGGIMSQLVPRMLEVGIPQGRAIALMLVSGISACIGSYLIGVFDAKVGAKKATMLVYFLAIAALILNLTGIELMIVISLIIIGVSVGGAANFTASICIEYWGRSGFANAFSVFMPIVQIMSAFGAVWFAQISARLGGYSASYIATIILLVITAIVFSSVNGNFVKECEEKFALEDQKNK